MVKICASNKTKLSQLAEKIFQGLFPPRKIATSILHKNFSIINIKDIINGRINCEGLNAISVRNDKNINRFIVYPGDVVVTCRGTLLKSAVVPKNLTGCLVSSNLIAIRLNGSFEPLLLSAFFQSSIGQKTLLSNVRSSTMQIALNVADIRKVEVPVIPADKQKKLAGLIKAANNYYNASVESANLRRDIAGNIIIKSFLQSSQLQETANE